MKKNMEAEKQLFLLADIVVGKIQSYNNNYTSLERDILEPVINDTKELLNFGLVILYAESVLSSIQRGAIFRIEEELTNKEPNLDKVRQELKYLTDFYSKVIGANKQDYISLPSNSTKQDLDNLEKNVARFFKTLPKAATGSELEKMMDRDNDHVKDLDELKEILSKMKRSKNG